MEYPSRAIEQAVEAFCRLPGVGKKSATRIVLNLLKEEEETVRDFSKAIEKLCDEVRYCRVCNNICEGELCNICSAPQRDHGLVCCVQDIRDVMAIETTGQFKGAYHVLGNLISPMDGIKPEDINVEKLVNKARNNELREVIFALSTTMEGDTTMFYIARQLKDFDIKTSTISRGISVGGELEFTDEITLSRSIEGRVPYNI